MAGSIRWVLLFTVLVCVSSEYTGNGAEFRGKSIRDFGVLPTNSAQVNKEKLQAAIDWASPRGAALFIEPSEEPYRIDGGLILRKKRLVDRGPRARRSRDEAPGEGSAGRQCLPDHRRQQRLPDR